MNNYIKSIYLSTHQVCSTVSGFSFRSPGSRFHERSDRYQESRQNRRNFQTSDDDFTFEDYDVFLPREQKRFSRRVVGAPPRYYEDRDSVFDIEGTIFNAPIPVTHEDEIREASRKRYDTVQEDRLRQKIRPKSYYSQAGIKAIPMQRLPGNGNPFEFAVDVPYHRSEQKKNLRKIKPEHRRRSQQPGEHNPSGSGISQLHPESIYKISDKRALQHDNTDRESMHPNHRYREDFTSSKRLSQKFRLPTGDAVQYDGRKTPHQIRAQISEPEIVEFHKKQKKELLHFRLREQNRNKDKRQQRPQYKPSGEQHREDSSVFQERQREQKIPKRKPARKQHSRNNNGPVPLAPVYSKDHLESSQEEPMQSEQARSYHDNERGNHIPEYAETLNLKEKRQAHHGDGYMDSNGLQVCHAVIVLYICLSEKCIFL